MESGRFKSLLNVFKKSDPKPPEDAPQAPDAAVAEPAAEAPATPAQSAEAPAEPSAVAEEKRGWAARLRDGLARTRANLGGKLSQLRQKVRKNALTDAAQVRGALAEAMTELLLPLQQPLVIETHRPFIIMLAGVNGAGKTTTIGKLAKWYQAQGKTILLAAGDTFRAAAREQLVVWGERNGVSVISQEKGDSAAVIFDAIHAARARGIDIVLADTAGRLPTQLNLMEEIKKVRRVITKAEPSGPHEVLLVLDANTGQNAVSQVKAFDDAIGLTGLAITKLDGTAKGGAIAAIASERPVPVRFIGVGEGIDDLRPFSARDFVGALFE